MRAAVIALAAALALSLVHLSPAVAQDQPAAKGGGKGGGKGNAKVKGPAAPAALRLSPLNLP